MNSKVQKSSLFGQKISGAQNSRKLAGIPSLENQVRWPRSRELEGGAKTTQSGSLDQKLPGAQNSEKVASILELE